MKFLKKNIRESAIALPVSASLQGPPDTAWPYKSALIIVAHPDDETLWAGGTILMHPETRWKIVALCRRSDPDRAPKFRRVLDLLSASGDMGTLDDGPEQTPLQASNIEDTVLALADGIETDLILTHNISGEYTRHRRHEETAKAVLQLWNAGLLKSSELWTFAYSDGGGRHPVNAVRDADIFTVLADDVWKRKRDLITEIYGFAPDSFEAKAALRKEAFWRTRFVT